MDLKTIMQDPKNLLQLKSQNTHKSIRSYLYQLDCNYLIKSYGFPDSRQAFARELQAWKHLQSSNSILTLLNFLESASQGLSLFNLSSFQPLSTLIQHNPNLNMHQLITNLLRSLGKIHQLRYIHRNLSLSSIFVTNSLEVKISGLEACVSLEELEKLYGVEFVEDIENSVFVEFSPPELMDLVPGWPVGSGVDMWCLGCIVYELVYKIKPFHDRESQIRGLFREVPKGFWRAVVKRLLAVDPRIRGSCEDILVLMASALHGPQKKASLFSKVFKNSTKSWVKDLTKDNDRTQSTEILARLIEKAVKKPLKIPKFYRAIQKRSLQKPKVCLKSLLLLHRYMLHGPKSVVSQSTVSFIILVSSLWVNAKNQEIQKYYSGTSRQVVVQYCKILESKYMLYLRLKSDWKNIEVSDADILEAIVDYYVSLQIYSQFLFNLCDFTAIYKDIITTILEEQQLIADSIGFSLRELKNSHARSIFDESHSKTLHFLHQFYVKYPLIDIPTNFLLGENIYKQRRISLGSQLDLPAMKLSLDPAKLPKVSFEIPLDSLKFNEIIGSGTSCTVYKGEFQQLEVAIKVMKAANCVFLKEFNREVETLRKIRHPNLVLFIGACIKGQLCIVSEYCKGGTLFNLLHERTEVRLSWKQRMKFAKDIATGMLFLHSSNPPIVHRDLKSLNLLLSEEISGPFDSCCLKISDFGLSRAITGDKMTGGQGTCHWMAPEVLNSSDYSLPADIYSFGIVLWELLSRETPYKDLSATAIPHHVLTLKKRPNLSSIPSTCPKGLKKLIKACWAQESSSRPTFSQILTTLESIDIQI